MSLLMPPPNPKISVSVSTAVRACLIGLVLMACASPSGAQDAAPPPPNLVDTAFISAPLLMFPSPTDSNTPLVWVGDELAIFSSDSGHTARATGTRLEDASRPDADELGSSYTDDIGSGRWLEAVIRDDDTGRLYGWYHNEIPSDCPQGVLLWPQIGATISDDDGVTWEDLGIILTPRDGTVSCDTEHPITNGGIGDFSVILDNNPGHGGSNDSNDTNADPGEHYLYFLYSSYGGDLEEQGISFARMRWIDRDQPLDRFSGQSAAMKWDGQGWFAPGIGGRSVAILHDAAQVPWDSSLNNGYW